MMKSKLFSYFSNWSMADFVIALTLLVFTAMNKLMPILLVLLGITLIAKRRNLKDYKQLILNPKNPLLWFAIFFSAHCLGLIYTNNTNDGIADVGMKLSFILMPIILGLVHTNFKLSHFIKFFVLGLTITCAIAYSIAVYKSIINREDNQWAYFTGSYLSYSMHRSYFATYLVIGFALSVYQFLKERNWFYVFASLLMGVTALLCYSKAGIIMLVLVAIYLLIHYSIVFNQKRVGLGLLLVFSLVSAVVFNSNKTLQVRFNKMIEALSSDKHDQAHLESSNSRVIMWETSWGLFSESPLIGVGTGDVGDELDRRNIELGNIAVAEESLNSHNQFLNTMVQLGLIGLIPLILIFLTSIRNAIRNNSLPYILITLILLFSLLFESFLETQAGIMPVTFILCLFILLMENEKRTSS